ncbi:hypothetical protein DFJ74DRAFT_459381 [Hyaloraphidium curvatum]|nr:hypothetical protein DFJ74DRAFT_459381 [Hyaloraphidium curvatum]
MPPRGTKRPRDATPDEVEMSDSAHGRRRTGREPGSSDAESQAEAGAIERSPARNTHGDESLDEEDPAVAALARALARDNGSGGVRASLRALLAAHGVEVASEVEEDEEAGGDDGEMMWTDEDDGSGDGEYAPVGDDDSGEEDDEDYEEEDDGEYDPPSDEDDEEDDALEERARLFRGIQRLLGTHRERGEDKLMKRKRTRTLAESNKLGLAQFVGKRKIRLVSSLPKQEAPCGPDHLLSASVISTARINQGSSFSQRDATFDIAPVGAVARPSDLSGTISIAPARAPPHPFSLPSTTHLSSFSWDPRLGLARFSWSFSPPADPPRTSRTAYDAEHSSYESAVDAAASSGRGIMWLCERDDGAEALVALMEAGGEPDAEVPAREGGPKEYGPKPGMPIGCVAAPVEPLGAGLRVTFEAVAIAAGEGKGRNGARRAATEDEGSDDHSEYLA